ncbi:MAG: DUF3747 domain-containing protein [Synechococcus lacustris]
MPVPSLKPTSLLLAGLLSGLTPLYLEPAQAALFQAKEVKGESFVLVAAPIGDGSSAQLNIYEQVRNHRPCFAKEGTAPTVIRPLLASFDFTGICSRYIDSNGYSVRIGDQDFGSDMRLSVQQQAGDTLLLGKATTGATLLVARTGGSGPGFLELKLEPGWKVMRRHFGPRALGHVYIYRDSWPE